MTKTTQKFKIFHYTLLKLCSSWKLLFGQIWRSTTFMIKDLKFIVSITVTIFLLSISILCFIAVKIFKRSCNGDNCKNFEWIRLNQSLLACSLKRKLVNLNCHLDSPKWHLICAQVLSLVNMESCRLSFGNGHECLLQFGKWRAWDSCLYSMLRNWKF